MDTEMTQEHVQQVDVVLKRMRDSISFWDNWIENRLPLISSELQFLEYFYKDFIERTHFDKIEDATVADVLADGKLTSTTRYLLPPIFPTEKVRVAWKRSLSVFSHMVLNHVRDKKPGLTKDTPELGVVPSELEFRWCMHTLISSYEDYIVKRCIDMESIPSAIGHYYGAAYYRKLLADYPYHHSYLDFNRHVYKHRASLQFIRLVDSNPEFGQLFDAYAYQLIPKIEQQEKERNEYCRIQGERFLRESNAYKNEILN